VPKTRGGRGQIGQGWTLNGPVTGPQLRRRLSIGSTIAPVQQPLAQASRAVGPCLRPRRITSPTIQVGTYRVNG
jgi:hypothetical protein